MTSEIVEPTYLIKLKTKNTCTVNTVKSTSCLDNRQKLTIGVGWLISKLYNKNDDLKLSIDYYFSFLCSIIPAAPAYIRSTYLPIVAASGQLKNETTFDILAMPFQKDNVIRECTFPIINSLIEVGLLSRKP